MHTGRPPLPWTLAVLAGLAAGLVGVVSLEYAWVLDNALLDEGLPIPEHVAWMLWFGLLATILGGLIALTLLVHRLRRPV